MTPMIKTLANHFVSERSSNEQIALGINCIREVFNRCPSLLLEEDIGDLVQDLAQYSRKSHKVVMAAARGLINLVRERYPALLKTKDRGKNSDKSAKPAAYGAIRPVTPEQLLRQQQGGEDDDEEDEEDGWEEVEEDDDDNEEDGEEGDWQSVEGDEEEEGEKDEVGSDDDNDGEGEWEDVEDEDDEEENGVEGEDEVMEEEDEDVWEEVSHDDDEEEEEEQEEKLGKRKRKGGEKVRGRLDVGKVLSDKDLDLIAKLQARRKKKVQFEVMEEEEEEEGQQQEKEEEEEEEEEDSDEEDNDHNEALDYVFNPDDLLPAGRVEKATKVERLRSILSGRTEKRFEGGHRGGLTNKEKERKKNYVMVRRGKDSLHNKNRRSSSEVRTKNAKRKDPYGRDRRKRRRT
eukprot:scaffold143_cov173-Ochromonas_danica.AAC.4